MVISRVIGTVVSTVKHPAFHGFKILIVQPLNLPDTGRDESFLAIDTQHAGVGDTVLVCQEGNSTRQTIGIPNAPIRSSIIAIIDSVSIRA